MVTNWMFVEGPKIVERVKKPQTRFAHGDAAYKTKILRYELENLNQLVV